MTINKIATAIIGALSVTIASTASATEWWLDDQGRCEIGRGVLSSPGTWTDSLRAQGRKSKTEVIRDLDGLAAAIVQTNDTYEWHQWVKPQFCVNERELY